jgi:hypothetical protein
VKLIDFSQIFRKSIVEGMQVNLVFFTTNVGHSIVDSEMENWNKTPLNLTIGGCEYVVEHNAIISDQNDLLTRFDSLSMDKPVDTNLRFNTGYWHESPVGGFKCLFATVTLEELAGLFDKHKYAIFRDNPRGPLGAVRVNVGIKNTLQNEGLRQYFHLLNNGLAATSESYTPPITTDGTTLMNTFVRDFQIVNGCQTTYTIWDFWRRGGNLKGAYVNIKLIEGKTLRDKISEYSNSQTQMKDWDFVSSDKIQKRLQAEFSKLHLPVMYELRRGEYKFMTTASDERVTVKDIAQTAWAFMGHPAEAKDKLRDIPQSRTSIGGLYHTVFFKECTASFYILPWRIYQKVKLYHEDYVKETNNQGDYREFGRLHVVWLISRALLRLLKKTHAKDIKPTEALNLVSHIDIWFDILHSIGVETVAEVFRVERKAAEKTGGTVSLRQLFRSEQNYRDFEATHDDNLNARKIELESISKRIA